MSAVLSWEMKREMNRTTRPDRDRQSDEAVEVLRDVWSAQGQLDADLEDAFGGPKACKRMQDVGFDDFADSGDDLRSAWRATLQRDGKLKPEAGSVADLVLGPSSDRRAE
jgi:hypothetical protein